MFQTRKSYAMRAEAIKCDIHEMANELQQLKIKSSDPEYGDIMEASEIMKEVTNEVDNFIRSNEPLRTTGLTSLKHGQALDSRSSHSSGSRRQGSLRAPSPSVSSSPVSTPIENTIFSNSSRTPPSHLTSPPVPKTSSPSTIDSQTSCYLASSLSPPPEPGIQIAEDLDEKGRWVYIKQDTERPPTRPILKAYKSRPPLGIRVLDDSRKIVFEETENGDK
jgi:hypothetical protein